MDHSDQTRSYQTRQGEIQQERKIHLTSHASTKMANSHDSCAIADEEKRVLNSAGEHPTEQTHCPKLSPQDRTSMWSMRSDDSIRAAHDARSEITACSRDAANTTDTDTDGEGVPPPPDGGYGWVCVFSCFLINAFSWGVVCVSPSFLLLAVADIR